MILNGIFLSIRLKYNLPLFVKCHSILFELVIWTFFEIYDTDIYCIFIWILCFKYIVKYLDFFYKYLWVPWISADIKNYTGAYITDTCLHNGYLHRYGNRYGTYIF